jgi:uncharacterized membrane protein YvbJ
MSLEDVYKPKPKIKTIVVVLIIIVILVVLAIVFLRPKADTSDNDLENNLEDDFSDIDREIDEITYNEDEFDDYLLINDEDFLNTEEFFE